ncbi:MAG: hypothetical protein EHM62_05605, partial [Methylococcus sp.]
MRSKRSIIPPGWRLLAGLILLGITTLAIARPPDAIESQSRALQSEWATVFYEAPRGERAPKYKDLLERTRRLKEKAPERAEPLIVEAIILCTYSA